MSSTQDELTVRRSRRLATPPDLGAEAVKNVTRRSQCFAGGRVRPLSEDQEFSLAR